MGDGMKSFLKKVLLSIGILIVLVLITHYMDRDKETKPVPIENSSSDLLEIYYFDVGQADSTLISYQNYHVLIDAGNTVDGVKLVPYFKELGIDHFDYVIATHAHEDHIGGMSRVVYNFPIDHFYMPNHSSEWKSYSNLMKALEKENVPLETPSVDSTFDLGDLHFMILWIGEDKEDYNENSIVLRLDFFNTSYLFMGDATGDSERNIDSNQLPCDVLKVGHHGSKYSSVAPFLETVKPKYAVISVGKENEYHYPHQVVLDKLEYLGVTVYRTDLNHTIHLQSNGRSIQFDFLETDLDG